MRARWLLAALLALSACDNGSNETRDQVGAADLTDAISDFTPPTPLPTGSPCSEAADCLGGLCLLNQYAPFRFCSASCDELSPGSFCQSLEPNTPSTSICVQMPDAFEGDQKRFCVPLCSTLSDCTLLGAPWERCDPIEWRGDLLLPSVNEQGCIAPSAHTLPVVDPTSCEGWETAIQASQEAMQLCQDYCEFLEACEFLDPSAVQACCQYHCVALVMEGAQVDPATFSEFNCYVQEFHAFEGSLMECQRPEENCGSSPTLP